MQHETQRAAGAELRTVAEVANVLRVSARQIARLVARGELPVVRIGKRVLLRDVDIAEFVAARRVPK